jgi:hypothetical protein
MLRPALGLPRLESGKLRRKKKKWLIAKRLKILPETQN